MVIVLTSLAFIWWEEWMMDHWWRGSCHAWTTLRSYHTAGSDNTANIGTSSLGRALRPQTVTNACPVKTFTWCTCLAFVTDSCSWWYSENLWNNVKHVLSSCSCHPICLVMSLPLCFPARIAACPASPKPRPCQAAHWHRHLTNSHDMFLRWWHLMLWFS